MDWLRILTAWVHLLLAIAWIGGMVFLPTVLLPVFRKHLPRDRYTELLRLVGHRFRRIAWPLIGLLVATGLLNLTFRGYAWWDLPRFLIQLGGPWSPLALKLELVGLLLVGSAVHDLVLGPRATALLSRAPGSPEAERMRRLSRILGLVNLVLAMLVVGAGAAILRGSPW